LLVVGELDVSALTVLIAVDHRARDQLVEHIQLVQLGGHVGDENVLDGHFGIALAAVRFGPLLLHRTIGFLGQRLQETVEALPISVFRLILLLESDLDVEPDRVVDFDVVLVNVVDDALPCARVAFDVDAFDGVVHGDLAEVDVGHAVGLVGVRRH